MRTTWKRLVHLGLLATEWTAIQGCSSDSQGGSGECNTLIDTAPSVTSSATSGTAPAASGGTVAEGTYYLTELNYFTGSASPTTVSSVSARLMMVLAANVMQQVGELNGGPEKRYTVQYASSGTTLSTTDICPPRPAPTGNSSTPFGYTASAGELRIYDSSNDLTVEEVLTKQ